MPTPCRDRAGCAACLKVQPVQRHYSGINDVVDDVCIWCQSRGECLSVAATAEATAQSCPRGDLVLGVEEACHCVEHSSSCEACLSEPLCIFVPESDANGIKLERHATLQFDGQRDVVRLAHPPACVRESGCRSSHKCPLAIELSNTAVVSNASVVVRYIEQFDHRLRLPVQPSCSQILSFEVTAQDPAVVYTILFLFFGGVAYAVWTVFLWPVCGPCLGEVCGISFASLGQLPFGRSGSGTRGAMI